VELRQVVAVVAVVAGAFASCTRVKVAKPSPSVSIGEGGTSGQATNGTGSVAGRGGDGDGGEHVGAGGALGNIELGVWPTFVANPQQSRDVQAVLASVSALSIGATTLPLAEPWSELSGATGSPRAVTWTRLDAMTQPFRDRGDGVALCIGLVDRTTVAAPLAGNWDSAEVTAALDRTIDEVYTRYSGSLSHLCFGYELDRYLTTVSKADQKRLLDLLKHAVDYASHHPQRILAKTAIGNAITLDALVAAGVAPLEDLMIGDEVVAVYDPLDEQMKLKPPESIVPEVESALETLAAAPGPRLPLTLFEVGYPSSVAAGSSEDAQKTYYDALFGVLETRRDEIGFVGVFGLGDRAAADCEAEALTFAGAGETEAAGRATRALVRCSMGLRAEKDKLAYTAVSAALSRYR
jgi:hypothetical protein